MTAEQTQSALKKFLEKAPKKVQLEILMHIQMAEGQANTSLQLSKELQKMITTQETKA